MQIRRVEEGEEYCYTDNGYEICCPICGTAWLEEIEGEFNIDNCEHLRFSLHSDRGDDFDIFEDWDSMASLKWLKRLAKKTRMRYWIYSKSRRRSSTLRLMW